MQAQKSCALAKQDLLIIMNAKIVSPIECIICADVWGRRYYYPLAYSYCTLLGNAQLAEMHAGWILGPTVCQLSHRPSSCEIGIGIQLSHGVELRLFHFDQLSFLFIEDRWRSDMIFFVW